jgi:hypothetical protein
MKGSWLVRGLASRVACRREFVAHPPRRSDIKGSSADPDVSSDTTFAELPPDAAASVRDTGGGDEGKRIREEVARVMANPEINGQPVALDFSSKGSKGG